MGYDQDHGYFGKGLDGYVHISKPLTAAPVPPAAAPGRTGTQAA